MRYLLILLLLLLPINAHAYLDPGTGSYIIQVFIAVVLGGLYACKIYWQRITAFISKLFSKSTGRERDS